MDRLFILILNNALVAGWFILAVMVLRQLFRKLPRWIHCLLWGLVAIRLAVPFSVESIFSLIPSAKPIPADIEYARIPQIDSGIQSINTMINPVLENNFAASEVASVNPIQVVIFIFSYVWFIGVLGLMLYALVSYFLLKRRVRASEFLDKDILSCKSIDSPFILGIVKPRIYVPDMMDSEAYICVTEHEKAHIKRGDHIWKPLGFLILSVYWFHPLCWLAYIMLCKDIEYACDEKVTGDKDKEWKAKYCQVLLDCSSQRRLVSACPVAFGEVSVKDRVKSVIRYRKPAFWIIVVSVIIAVIVAVCFMTNPKKDNKMGLADSEGNSMEAAPDTEEMAPNDEEPETIQNSVHEYHVDENRLFVEMWAKAFCDRAGDIICKYSSDHVKNSLEMEAANGVYVFGASSPWPWNHDWYRIDKISDSSATIYYYALTSDPHVTVWRQHITFERDNETDENIVQTISTDKYENIVLSSEFDMAYGEGLFWMDYKINGVGEALNKNAMLSSSTAYKDLWEPDTAARTLLNLLPNESKIPIEIADGENENEKILYITFMEDNQTRIIKMIQPWGKEGIWIPFGWTNNTESDIEYLPVENIADRVEEGENVNQSSKNTNGVLVYDDWVLPVKNWKLSGYFGETQKGKASDHISIPGKEGDAIFAVSDGVVSEKGFDNVDGYYVVISIDEHTKVKYGHLESVLVEAGDSVNANDEIGLMGKTGQATGVNLSFAVNVDGEYINPLRQSKLPLITTSAANKSVVEPRMDKSDENMNVDYIEDNGQYIVEGDMVFMDKRVLVGQNPSAGYPVQYIVLTNDKDITWEQVDKSFCSSSLVDGLPGTVIIGMKVLD